ncbi:isochorismatase [Bacillus manliponensis]|uniref:isochorismatase n=1 Tax=Bacillus manliponensis TaxID=574376 RepID=UPI00351869CA
MIQLQETYKKRPIRFLDTWEHEGWLMKIYGVSYENEYPREQLITVAKKLAATILPQPAIFHDRYGVGFIGVHDGKDSSFIFIDWWSNENELNHHVYIASHETPHEFEYYTPKGLIACCWDLKILNFERDAWVQTVLNHPHGTPSLDEYMQLQFNEDV